MKRELGSFERALVIADQYAPFHSVYVLKLESPPPSHFLELALRSLQKRHPFLRARLLQETRNYYFASMVEPMLVFRVLPRWSDTHWVKVAEVELEARTERPDDPMFRCTYLYSENQEHAEIILTFFQPIVDAASADCLMDELLTACASYFDGQAVSVSELDPAPAQESRFPSSFRGVQRTWNVLGYGIRQALDDILYHIQTRGKRTPPLHKKPSHGHIISLTLPEPIVSAIIRRVGMEKVTFDALLHAVLMMAVNRHLYAGKNIPMRTFSFWDMRPFVQPPLPNEYLGNYVSLLRHSVFVEGGVNVWDLARSLQQKFHRSIKSGEHFAAATSTESLIKQMTGRRSSRMGATALNFHGDSQLKKEYGVLTVEEMHAYVSAYDLGPEFSGQARFFNDQLIWDFTYLDSDMRDEEARAIVEEIKSILNSAVSSPLFMM